MGVVLKSRIPEIIASLPGDVDEATHRGTEAIAEDAASRAPIGATGDLSDSIEAKDGSSGYGVYAIWRWFFTEFGTVNQGAQPFMVPAKEARERDLIDEVKGALGDL